MSISFETKMYGLAFLTYFLAGGLIVFLLRWLAQRYWELSPGRSLIIALVAALVGCLSFVFLTNYDGPHGNVGGGSGIGAVISVTFFYAAGALVGLLSLLIGAWVLGKRIQRD